MKEDRRKSLLLHRVPDLLLPLGEPDLELVLMQPLLLLLLLLRFLEDSTLSIVAFSPKVALGPSARLLPFQGKVSGSHLLHLPRSL